MNALTKVMTQETPLAHTPVMLTEAVDALLPADGQTHVDATFGRGGYAGALLAMADCRVIAIDRDPEAIALGRAMAGTYGDQLVPLEGRFGDMQSLLEGLGIVSVDGVIFDLGVSSPQLDAPERGFSFRTDGPLDMRMGPSADRTAADLVNTLSEQELARLIFELGEEKHARRVARAIAATRAEEPITRTGRLAAIVRAAVPRSADGLDPATRTFQALRIHVNDELGELERGLTAAERVLRPGGRLVVVSFHSLEDRVVKDFLRRRAIGAPAPSRHAPVPVGSGLRQPSFRLMTRRPIGPSEAELAANPRARSARLRVAERTEAPVFAPSWDGPARGGAAWDGRAWDGKEGM